MLTARNCEFSKSRKVHIRGSAMSIPLDGGFLFVTHKSLHGCGNFFTNLTVISEFLDFEKMNSEPQGPPYIKLSGYAFASQTTDDIRYE